MRRIAIIGSRAYADLAAVRRFVRNLPEGTVVVSGGALGVDSEAEKAATARGLPTMIFPADWKKHGKRAGFLRNREIVDACDELVGFWDGASRGTAHSVALARAAGKPVRVFRPGAAPPDRPETVARSAER